MFRGIPGTVLLHGLLNGLLLDLPIFGHLVGHPAVITEEGLSLLCNEAIEVLRHIGGDHIGVDHCVPVTTNRTQDLHPGVGGVPSISHVGVGLALPHDHLEVFTNNCQELEGFRGSSPQSLGGGGEGITGNMLQLVDELLCKLHAVIQGQLVGLDVVLLRHFVRPGVGDSDQKIPFNFILICRSDC